MMKTIFLNLSVLLMFNPIYAQEQYREPHPFNDPFLLYIAKMYRLTSFEYECTYREKKLFSIDTTVRNGWVTIGKKSDSIQYLRITEKSGPYELLLIRDTAWSVNHDKREVFMIGRGSDKVSGNQLSNYFPLSLFTLDTSAYQLEPFWETIIEREYDKVVSIRVQNTPEEVTHVRYELTFNNADSLLYLVVEDVEFGQYIDYQYQERSFYNYRIPGSIPDQPPDYFNYYRKILPDHDKSEIKPEQDFIENHQVIKLTGLELWDLDGQVFNLPGDGLIFIDLWYVGCYPCMKAAPVIDKLYLEFRNQIHFFSVNEVDKDLAKISRFAESLGISFPVLINRQEKLAEKVNGSNAYPAYFIMDAKTTEILWRESGYSEDLEEKIREAFESSF